jgi:hypothetical protein
MQIAIDLQARVEKLEQKTACLDHPFFKPSSHAEETVTITPAGLDALKKTERAMCPKCGVKPNYFFHVKTCTGQKDGDKATDRRRDQS